MFPTPWVTKGGIASYPNEQDLPDSAITIPPILPQEVKVLLYDSGRNPGYSFAASTTTAAIAIGKP